MFEAVSVPFGAKMLFNTVKLKPGVTTEDVEMAIGEMCSVVKDRYGGDAGGFIGGQVFRFSGFVSNEGSLGGAQPSSRSQHERDHRFRDRRRADADTGIVPALRHHFHVIAR